LALQLHQFRNQILDALRLNQGKLPRRINRDNRIWISVGIREVPAEIITGVLAEPISSSWGKPSLAVILFAEQLLEPLTGEGVGRRRDGGGVEELAVGGVVVAGVLDGGAGRVRKQTGGAQVVGVEVRGERGAAAGDGVRGLGEERIGPGVRDRRLLGVGVNLAEGLAVRLR